MSSLNTNSIEIIRNFRGYKSNMKFILLLFYILIFFSINCQAVTLKRNDLKTITIESKTKTNRNDNSKQHDTLSTIKSFNKNYNSEYLDNFIKQQSLYNSNFSNQISTLNTSLTFWGIIISIVIAVASIYFTYILKKTTTLLTETEELKDEVLVLQESIENNFDEIYEKMLNRQLDDALERIKHVPDDINHVFPTIASTKIPVKYFTELRRVAISWNEADLEENLHLILRLICQHYPLKTVEDNTLFNIVINEWDDIYFGLYIEEFRILIKHYCKRIITNGLHDEISNIKKIIKSTDTNRGILPSHQKQYREELVKGILKYLSKEDQYDILLFLDNDNENKILLLLLNNYNEKYVNEFEEKDKKLIDKYKDKIEKQS